MHLRALSLRSKSLIRNVTSLSELASASQTSSITIHHRFRRSFRLGRPTTQFGASADPSHGSDPSTWDVLRNIQTVSTQHSVLVFYSTSHNPYHNLAIEHYLLRNSDHGSRILLFYANRPCVVIGRNQNPWLECNIAKIQEGLPWNNADWHGLLDQDFSHREGEKVSLDLIRRRSGGGTVVHDVGNLNFSVIVPNDKAFTRAVHAEMVVRALADQEIYDDDRCSGKRLYKTVRVNDRNDIVMRKRNATKGDKVEEYKITGSAYKLTRGRAMHHGTLLHSSPNVRIDGKAGDSSISVFSTLLTSPGKSFIDAKGVGSVPSPVYNLFDVGKNSSEEISAVRNALRMKLVHAITTSFWDMYAPSKNQQLAFEVGDEDCTEAVNADIAKDAHELQTDEWRFEQTPQFEFHSSPAPSRETNNSADMNSQSRGFSFRVKSGVIQDPKWQGESTTVLAALEGKKLHQIGDWTKIVSSGGILEEQNTLSRVFPRINLSNIKPVAVDKNKINPLKHEKQGQPSDQVKNGDSTIIRETSSGQVQEIERKGQNLIEEHTETHK